MTTFKTKKGKIRECVIEIITNLYQWGCLTVVEASLTPSFL